jgi:hypothetical protein
MSLLYQARSVLTGEAAAPALDDGSTKVLFFMLERSEGCDATISADRFSIQYGWHPSHHQYKPDIAPRVLGWLRLFVRDGELGPGLLPWWGGGKHDLPYWAFGRRRVWFDASSDRIVVCVRDARAGLDRRALPAPIEPPIEYLVIDHACPHCASIPERYRKLRGGGLVCLACGRSSPEPST